MTTGELRDLSYDDLMERLAEAKAELFNLRFQLATNQLDNTAEMRRARRQIARISTILREQELAEWAKTKDERQKTSDRNRS
jgi:large subunit ribosomal protein L29